MSALRRTGALGCLILVALVARARADDDTGGSMGGGDWGSTGGSYSGSYDSSSSGGSYDYSYTPSYGYDSSSSSSSSSSYDYGGYYDSSDNTGSSGGRITGLKVFAPFGILLGIIMLGGIVKHWPRRRYSVPITSYYPSTPADAVDVGVIRIVVDGRARAFVQAELGKIAKSADTKTAHGRAAMLRQVAKLLRTLRDTWMYGGARNEPMTAKSNAQSLFTQHVDAARAKFKHETIRNAQGVITTSAGPDHVPRSHEGAGVILVTIVLATRNELFTILRIGDGEDLRKALEAIESRPSDDLVAVEIIWQPSKPDDRMSSIELEAKYPHPHLIKITRAVAGRTFCQHCSGPYPAELVSCPHCGASSVKAA